MIKIFNEDCNLTLDRFIENGTKVDIILTSPPYNNSRVVHTSKSMNTHNCRYDEYDDNMTNEEYCDWTVNIFNKIDKVLSENGVILYNISYGGENPDCMWQVVSDIIERTNFMASDVIVWKKTNALPNNMTTNKLTRIFEFVIVFSRRSEFDTFFMNKAVSGQSRTGQNYYNSIFNMIEARNNDGKNPLNNAAYSSELCEKLLNIYGKAGMTVYDPFMGTGTTAVACKMLRMNCYGSELSSAQCEYANNRINESVVLDKETYSKQKLF